MIKAERILIFINALEVPFLMDDINHSWDLAEFAEEYAYNIARKHKQKVQLSLSLAPSRHASHSLVRTDTFQTMYRNNVIKALDKVDAIAIIPCLGSAGCAPDWLKEEADKRYITIATFTSFFGSEDSDILYRETSRRRMLLVRARRPEGREGRGARVK